MGNQIRTYFGIFIPPYKEEKVSKRGDNVTLRFVLQDYFPSKKNKIIPFTERSEAKKHITKSFENLPSVISKEQAIKIATDAIYKVNSRIVGSTEYKEFVKENKDKLQLQMKYYHDIYGHKGLIFPISKGKIKIRFLFKSNYRLDTISKEESILDILVSCGVIADDNRFILNPAVREGISHKGNITEDIADIYITIPLKSKK